MTADVSLLGLFVSLKLVWIFNINHLYLTRRFSIWKKIIFINKNKYDTKISQKD